MGYECSPSSSNPNLYNCNTVCNDGITAGNEQCDDGNEANSDGCDENCSIEYAKGFDCEFLGVKMTANCMKICGDGITEPGPGMCDDKNMVNGDGCSLNCQVEDGFTCALSTDPATPYLSVCPEICGDNRLMLYKDPNNCDDGNTESGDGCDGNCNVESGFYCKYGSPLRPSACFEICGDGVDHGFHNCEHDGVTVDQGCTQECDFDECYTCDRTAGVSNCYEYIIDAEIEQVDDHYKLQFSNEMNQTAIGKRDLQVILSTGLTLDWHAKYTSPTSADLYVTSDIVYSGKEQIIIKFLNYQTFRGPKGGCVRPETLEVNTTSSLANQTQAAESAGDYLFFFVIGGMLVLIGTILLLGASLELIWSLINTLQMISFLPLMINNYPSHVTAMFEVLEIANFEISIFSELFEQYTGVDALDTEAFNERFADFGVESPLFLENCSSLIFSLGLSILSLLITCVLYVLICAKCFRNFAVNMIQSYFFNNFLRFLTEGFLEIFFGAFLNTVSFNMGNSLEMTSTAIGLVTCILCISFVAISFAQLYDKRKQIGKGNELYLKRFGTMYCDLKTDGHWSNLQFYPIFMARRMIFVIGLIFFLDYPTIQCNCLIMFCAMGLFYQTYQKPFKHTLINVLWVINECLFLGIVLIQNIFITDIVSVSIASNTGWVMNGLMVAMVAVNFSIIIIQSIIRKVSTCVKKPTRVEVLPPSSGNEALPAPRSTINANRTASVVHF